MRERSSECRPPRSTRLSTRVSRSPLHSPLHSSRFAANPAASAANSSVSPANTADIAANSAVGICFGDKHIRTTQPRMPQTRPRLRHPQPGTHLTHSAALASGIQVRITRISLKTKQRQFWKKVFGNFARRFPDLGNAGGSQGPRSESGPPIRLCDPEPHRSTSHATEPQLRCARSPGFRSA